MGHKTRISTACLVAGAALVLASCGPTAVYRPYFDEGGSGASIDQYTFVSYPHAPKTLNIVDTRTDEVVFAMDIPVGQQLVIDFEEMSKDQGNYLSGTMKWAVMDAGDRYGKLPNRVAVPPPYARRIDWYLREGPEVSNPPQVETMAPPPLSDDTADASQG